MRLGPQSALTARHLFPGYALSQDRGVFAAVETRCQACCNACRAQAGMVPALTALACVAACQSRSGGLCRC